MKRYKYKYVDNSPEGNTEEGIGNIVDMERLIPEYIISYLKLFEQDPGPIDLKVQAGHEYFEITKV